MEREGEGCNLVEKEGASVGQLDLSGTGFGGSGEGSAFAAKQLGLDEIFRERGAVEADVGFGGSGAERDDGPGNEFLAGTAFAADEDIHAAVCDLLDRVIDTAHGFAGADKVLEAAALLGVTPHLVADSVVAALAQGIGEGEAQLGDVDGAAEVEIGAGLEGLLFDRAGAGAAERDEDEVVIELAQFAQNREAAVPLVRVVGLGVDVEEDGDDVGFACPAGEVGEVFAQHDLEPWDQFGDQLIEKLLIGRHDADDGKGGVGEEGGDLFCLTGLHGHAPW